MTPVKKRNFQWEESLIPGRHREDEIRWVEFELRRAKHGADWEKSAIAENPRELEIWLARARDKDRKQSSWQQIGDQYFSGSKMKPEARRSEARRAYERVERYLKNPNAREFDDRRLRRLIQETFGVSAQDFRVFIQQGRLPRPKK